MAGPIRKNTKQAHAGQLVTSFQAAGLYQLAQNRFPDGKNAKQIILTSASRPDLASSQLAGLYQIGGTHLSKRYFLQNKAPYEARG